MTDDEITAAEIAAKAQLLLTPRGRAILAAKNLREDTIIEEPNGKCSTIFGTERRRGIRCTLVPARIDKYGRLIRNNEVVET